MASRSRARSGRSRRSPWIRRFKLAFAFGAIVFFATFIGLFLMFFSLIKEAEAQMPTLEEKFTEAVRPPSRILTRDGVELYRVSKENRIPLKLNDIPDHVKSAILAAEDKRFYQHNGVDEQGLLRAFVSIFKEGQVTQGGSTITMQLAKRLYNGNERSFRRKMQDIAFAYVMEREVANKNRLLELYLNQVYFGEGAHGIGAAAKTYFNKTVKQLTLSDAAILARCVRIPVRENPIKNYEVAMENRDVVLRVMKTENLINDKQYDKAIAEKPKLNKKPPATTAFYTAGYAQHFVQHVLKTIDNEDLGIDLKRGGYTIYTTIDSELQKLAERSVRRIVSQNKRNRINQGAFVAIDRDGKILCEVGGVSFKYTQYNVISQGRLQPGSGFKPFVYATALREGAIGMGEYISNAPISLPNGTGGYWQPKNASPRENASSYSLETALALSVNRPAIHTIMKVTPHRVAETARTAFGFRTKLEEYPPLALGSTAVSPLEMAEGYSVFMLKGDRVRPYLISKIVDTGGTLVKEYYPEKFAGVFDPRVAEQIDVLLRAVVTNGTGGAAQPVPNARGKTGTTNNAKDAWFVGYADGVLGAAWVGNQRIVNGQWTVLPMGSSVYGGTTAAHIWAEVIKRAREKYGKQVKYDQPSTVAARDTKTVPALREKPERAPSITPADFGGDDNNEPADDPEPKPRKREEPPKTAPVTPAVAPDTIVTPPPTQDEDLTGLQEAEKVDRPKPRRERERREEPTRQVEICADSGQVATAYCPETVTRTFGRSSAPRRRCRVHGPGE